MSVNLPVKKIPTAVGHRYAFVASVRSYARPEGEDFIIGIYNGNGHEQGEFVAMSNPTCFSPQNHASTEDFTEEMMNNYKVSLVEIV